MRNLSINKSTMYLLRYLGTVESKDSDGFSTGETTNKYSKPIEFKASLSGARGTSQAEVFGTEINYDKTIVMSKKKFLDLRINEYSVLFVDKKPTHDTTGFPLYNYKIEAIAETVNEVSIAIKKVRAD